jgi:hypothetical protein
VAQTGLSVRSVVQNTSYHQRRCHPRLAISTQLTELEFPISVHAHATQIPARRSALRSHDIGAIGAGRASLEVPMSGTRQDDVPRVCTVSPHLHSRGVKHVDSVQEVVEKIWPDLIFIRAKRRVAVVHHGSSRLSR